MFILRRPSANDINGFLDASRRLPLSYHPPGIVNAPPLGFRLDEHVVVIGHGRDAFERACGALITWKQSDIGWAKVYPDRPGIEVGTVAAVLVRHLGFWSLNGCRVLYHVGSRDDARFGFAYGTLTNHAECGEELFEVFLDPQGDVVYRIRASSRPRAVLARVGHPICPPASGALPSRLRGGDEARDVRGCAEGLGTAFV
jgi:uncharacterized protein (UPF0548 family)